MSKHFRNFVFLSFAIVTLLPTLSAQAAEPVTAQGRLHAYSTTYWSAVDGEFSIRLYDETIPWGSQVFLRHGWTNSEWNQGQLVELSSWTDLEVTEVPAVAPYQWEIKLQKQLYTRGSSYHLTALQFVFEVHSPDGDITYIKGSDSKFGYYDVETPRESPTCYPWGDSYCSLWVKKVSKD